MKPKYFMFELNTPKCLAKFHPKDIIGVDSRSFVGDTPDMVFVALRGAGTVVMNLISLTEDSRSAVVDHLLKYMGDEHAPTVTVVP